MAFINFELNLNHLFFLLFIIVYFIRKYIIDIVSESIIQDDSSGKAKQATKKLFNMYIYIFSDLLCLFFVCIIKIRSKKIQKTNNLLQSINSLEYIYSPSLPDKTGNILIKTFLVAVFDFIAQFPFFILYFVVNDDSKFENGDKMDITSIIKILSIYLLSRVFLKTYYYNHHYLSFGINIICIVALGAYELIQFDYEMIKIIFRLFRLFSTIFFSLEDVIGKKALIEEFLSPYSLLVYKGLFELILLSLYSIPFFFIKRDEDIIFSKMINFVNGIEPIFFNIIVMIINCIYNIIIWMIIDKFSPNDYAMTTIIEGIT